MCSSAKTACDHFCLKLKPSSCSAESTAAPGTAGPCAPPTVSGGRVGASRIVCCVLVASVVAISAISTSPLSGDCRTIAVLNTFSTGRSIFNAGCKTATVNKLAKNLIFKRNKCYRKRSGSSVAACSSAVRTTPFMRRTFFTSKMVNMMSAMHPTKWLRFAAIRITHPKKIGTCREERNRRSHKLIKKHD